MTAADIAIFVDCSSKNDAPMLLKPSRIIGPAAEKGYPKRGSGNDHDRMKISRKADAAFFEDFAF